jgi:hypothetical protein
MMYQNGTTARQATRRGPDRRRAMAGSRKRIIQPVTLLVQGALPCNAACR